MFRSQMSGQAKSDKLDEAIQFAKEVTEYINSKYAPLSIQAYSGIVDDDNTIYWYSDYKDLSTIESFRAKLRSDQEYWALVFKGLDCFVERSFHETLMSTPWQDVEKVPMSGKRVSKRNNDSSFR